MIAASPDMLRTQARHVRELAQRASGQAYYDALDLASDLEEQAHQLEREIEDRSSPGHEVKRKRLVAKVKIAQKQLNLDDDTYRDLLFSVTKKRSASKLVVYELEDVMRRMRKLGFKDKPAKAAKAAVIADDQQSKKIRALWIELVNAGKVFDPSERSLVNWVKGQLKSSDGIEALQWLSERQKRRIIEQLKLWLSRK